MNTPPPARPAAPRFGTAWAVAVTVIAVAAILVGAGLYVFRSVSGLPGEAGLLEVHLLRGLHADPLGRSGGPLPRALRKRGVSHPDDRTSRDAQHRGRRGSENDRKNNLDLNV